MVHVFFIYAENCNHCQEALNHIESAVKKCQKIPCEIHKMMYDSKEAISLAISRGIEDLPGIVIGDKVFVKLCTEKEIINAIKKADNG